MHFSISFDVPVSIHLTISRKWLYYRVSEGLICLLQLCSLKYSTVCSVSGLPLGYPRSEDLQLEDFRSRFCQWGEIFEIKLNLPFTLHTHILMQRESFNPFPTFRRPQWYLAVHQPSFYRKPLTSYDYLTFLFPNQSLPHFYRCSDFLIRAALF